jgi:transposase-like protein
VKGVSFLGRIQGIARTVTRHWYYQDGINDCDFAEMMLGRRVTVDSPTIFRWVQRYAPGEKRLVTEDRDPLLLNKSECAVPEP